MRKTIVLACLVLAACGVDGEPVQPAGGVNITLNNDGVGLGANVGVNKGPVQIGMGLGL